VNEGRRYQILGVLGRGGFGTVYRADLLGEGSFVRPVALKVLNADMEDVATVAERLRDEARLLGRIRHRAVVHVDGLVRLDDRWTIVMEYVDGADLGRVLEQHGRFPPRPAFEIVGEVASALHVVHTWPGVDGRPLGILHRDVKPANLLVTAAGEVKVVDFGVARGDVDSREAHTRNMRFGSPGYVAPERLEGDERPEGDVYSLGVVLYELLAARAFGKATVRRERHAEMLEQACNHLPTLPIDATQLLRRMLAWDPEDRPAAREIERACRDLVPVLSGPYLRDWTEKVVPGTLASRQLGDPGSDFKSRILTERVSQLAQVPQAEPGSQEVPPPPVLRASATSTLDDLVADGPADAPPPPPPLPPARPPPTTQAPPLSPPPTPFSAPAARPPPPLPFAAPVTGSVSGDLPPAHAPPAIPPRHPPAANRMGPLTVLFDLLALSAGVSVLVVVAIGVSIAMCMGITVLGAVN
jgi:serine/threonine protein kinase